jgi:hypothetical protein
MKFDYKQRLHEREKRIDDQKKLLDTFVESIKQPFRDWYKEVDRSKVDWLISQFLLDCGYHGKQIDFQLYFTINTGKEETHLKKITLIVRQYGMTVKLGELSRQLTLAEIRGDKP